MHLNEYQLVASQTDQQPETGAVGTERGNILVPLLGLAGEVGELLGEHKKWIRGGDSYRLYPERVREELGDLLWYLSNVATKHGLTLEEVAGHNLDKTRRRWHVSTSGGEQRKLLDDDFPDSERIPRLMNVSVDSGKPGWVEIFINGQAFGHALRDNRYEDDGYRFHDIFHLTYASVLGWSPTLRALMRRKRKSDPRVDEVEDGGRAIVIEEGISAMVFSYAERRDFLDGAEAVNYELLRTIRDMTSHLEVRCRTEGNWEHAILRGFELWRQVRAKGKGRLRADLDSGTIDLTE